MTREDKKALEFAFAVEFLQTKGITENIVHDDAPDVLILNSINNTIGIEVTLVFCDSVNGVPREQLEGNWDIIRGILKKKWQEHMLPIVHVILTFDETIHFKKPRDKIISEIFDLVVQFLPDEDRSYCADDLLCILPKGIKNLTIRRVDFMVESEWTFNDSTWSPPITKEKITERIEHKEKLRLSYLDKCNEIWLLIVMYGGRASGNFFIEETIFQRPYDFQFDKVFVFNALSLDYWELHKSN